MRKAIKTPFDEGRIAVKDSELNGNPYPVGSLEHDNYERGRQYGMRIQEKEQGEIWAVRA